MSETCSENLWRGSLRNFFGKISHLLIRSNPFRIDKLCVVFRRITCRLYKNVMKLAKTLSLTWSKKNFIGHMAFTKTQDQKLNTQVPRPKAQHPSPKFKPKPARQGHMLEAFLLLKPVNLFFFFLADVGLFPIVFFI